MNASRLTDVTFSSGDRLSVKGSPDEIIDTIAKSQGQPIRLVDAGDYVHWVNPSFVRSVVSWDEPGVSA